jgi:hypothetical protein
MAHLRIAFPPVILYAFFFSACVLYDLHVSSSSTTVAKMKSYETLRCAVFSEKKFNAYTNRMATGSSPEKVTGYFNWPNRYSCTMALVLIQPLTEMSTTNASVVKGPPARKAESHTFRREPPRHTNLWAITTCDRIRSTYTAPT